MSSSWGKEALFYLLMTLVSILRCGISGRLCGNETLVLQQGHFYFRRGRFYFSPASRNTRKIDVTGMPVVCGAASRSFRARAPGARGRRTGRPTPRPGGARRTSRPCGKGEFAAPGLIPRSHSRPVRAATGWTVGWAGPAARPGERIAGSAGGRWAALRPRPPLFDEADRRGVGWPARRRRRLGARV